MSGNSRRKADKIKIKRMMVSTRNLIDVLLRLEIVDKISQRYFKDQFFRKELARIRGRIWYG